MTTYFINWKYATDGHYEEGNKSYKSINAARKAIMNEIENRWDVFSGTVARQDKVVKVYAGGKKQVTTVTIGVVNLKAVAPKGKSFIYKDYKTRNEYWLNNDGSLSSRV